MINSEEKLNGISNEQYAESASIEAKAIAIESNSLVLKTVDTGELLHWPLNKITKPFRIGNSIMLTLRYDKNETEDRETRAHEKIAPSPQKTPPNTDSEKRKLLEKLLN